MIKKLVLLFLGVVAALIIYVSTASFDSPELGRAVLARASEASGIELQATAFRLSLREGLLLQGVTAESKFPGGRYRIELDEIRCEYRLMPLLSGNVQIERVLLDTPRVEIFQGDALDVDEPKAARAEPSETRPQDDSSSAEPASESAESAEPVSFELSVSEIQLSNAEIVFRDNDKDQLNVVDFDLRLTDLDLRSGALTALHGLSSRGEFTVSELNLETLSVRDVRGTLNMAEGRFSMKEVEFEVPEGSFQTAMEIDFNSFPFTYEMTLVGDPIDANLLASSGPDGGFGPATLQMDANGVGTDPNNFKATGTLALAEGTLPSTPVLSAVEASMGRTHLIGAPYEATEVPFRVEKHRLHIDRLRLVSPELGIDAAGTIELKGPLSLDATLKTPRDQLRIKEIRDEVLDVLTDDEGFVLLPYAISGSIEEPKIQLDARQLARQARQGAGRVAKEKILEGIGGFFGRKKKR